MDSKWGYEEVETVESIKKAKFQGKVLNLAAGYGRFNNLLLKQADSVVAIDIDENEISSLIKDCPSNLRDKLSTVVADITKKLPFEENSFDGIFCTGTLHLFDKQIIKSIISEITRILKPNGKIVIDFATDIKRVKKDGQLVTFEGEGNYKIKEAIKMFDELLRGFNIQLKDGIIKDLFLKEENYTFNCNFIVIYGKKKMR
jgi:ubiquinone/menaquinone biosynthesis C-methylase UbiE